MQVQFFDNNGLPLAGGKLYMVSAGGAWPTDALTTYSDAALSTPNTNPIILDSSGKCYIWLQSRSYKIIAHDSADVPVWTDDNVADMAALLRVDLADADNGSDLIGYTPAGGSATTVKDRLDAINYGRATVKLIASTNITIAEADNPALDRRDITISSAAAAGAGMKAQGDGGIVSAARDKINFVTGNNAVVTVADAAGDDRVNVILAATMAAETNGATPIDARRRLNFKTGTFMSPVLADNAAGDCIDVTLNADGMKAQKAGGTILGGRAKVNFIEGANITLTVADAPLDDRINVTIAAAGSTFPTISQSSGAVNVTNSTSQGVKGVWAEMIAASTVTCIHIIFSASSYGSLTYQWDIGTGLAGAEVVKIADIVVASGIYAMPYTASFPFSIASGTRVVVRCANMTGNQQFTFPSGVVLLG